MTMVVCSEAVRGAVDRSNQNEPAQARKLPMSFASSGV
jgi:hypothetical protein